MADGQIYYQAAPSRIHQRILLFLARRVADYIDSKNGICEVNIAPFAVFLDDDTNYFEPDISVVCDPSKLDNKGCHGAPDWVMEIVSPSSKFMDYYIKLIKYRENGVREYWIINPESETVTVYRFEEGKETVDSYKFDSDIPSSVYEDFSVKISEYLK